MKKSKVFGHTPFDYNIDLLEIPLIIWESIGQGNLVTINIFFVSLIKIRAQIQHITLDLQLLIK